MLATKIPRWAAEGEQGLARRRRNWHMVRVGKNEEHAEQRENDAGADPLDALILAAHNHPAARPSRVRLMVLGEAEVSYIGPAKTFKQRDGTETPVRFFGLELRVREGTREFIQPVKCSAWGARLVKLAQEMRRGSRVQILGDLSMAPDRDLRSVPSLRVSDMWVLDE